MGEVNAHAGVVKLRNARRDVRLARQPGCPVHLPRAGVNRLDDLVDAAPRHGRLVVIGVRRVRGVGGRVGVVAGLGGGIPLSLNAHERVKRATARATRGNLIDEGAVYCPGASRSGYVDIEGKNRCREQQ